MAKTILVVDDEPGYRAFLSCDLSLLGYTILTAGSGPEALDLLGRHQVDMIVSDMRMSPMDGLDTVIAARKINPTVPIVLMTGDASEERVEEALRHHVDRCLRKPFEIDEMRGAVQALIGDPAN